MTKKIKNILLGLFSFAAVSTMGLSVAFSSGITVEAQDTNVFEMVYGAGIRVSDPTGMRFKTKFSENYYEELTASDTDTQLFVSVFPYSDYIKYDTSGQDLEPWLNSYYGAGKYINIAMDPEKFYQVSDDDCYYGNAVISNIYFNNYHRDFVGVAYLRRGTAGNYTYEYTTKAITKEDNARSVFEVATKANMNEEDHAKHGDVLETLIKNGLYGAYGVTYDKNANTYSLNGTTYTSLEAIDSVVKLDEATLSLANETLTIGESKQLMPALTYSDGTAFNKDANLVWSSSTPSVATVDEKGEITAVAAGETTITVTACGGLYSTTSTITVSKVDLIGTVIENTLYDPTSDYVGTATSEVSAPAGFENVHKFTEATSDPNGYIHGGNYSAKNLDNYSFVTFAVKTPNILLDQGGWNTSNEWLVFEMTQTGEALWTINVSQNGNVIHTATNMSGNRDGGAYVYNALDSILFGVPSTGFYVGAADGALTAYFTEVRGIKIPVEPVGTIIDECAYEVVEASFNETTEIANAEGFEKLYKHVSAGENIHGMLFSGKNLDNYELVTFAVKTANFNMNSEGANESNEWLIFTLTQVSPDTWDLVVTCDGAKVFEKSGLNGAYNSEANPAYSDNALDAILYGNPSGFSPTSVNGELVVYVTELRGISTVVEPEPEPEEPEVELIGEKIAESATLVGQLKVGDQHVTATTEIAAPAGFGNVYKYVEVREAFHGANYSDLCLTDYSVVTFAVKATKMRMNSDWDESNEWLVFTMTQTSEAFWTIVVTKKGEVIHTATEVNGTRDDGSYAYNTLASILYGKSDYVAWNVDGTVTMYVTELRDLSNAEEPDGLPGDEITECAAMLGTMDTGSNPMQKTTEIAAPAGFGSVYKYEDQGEAFHGGNYSNVCLTEYSVVTFAVKSAKMKLYGDWNESNDWLVFTMTQTSEAVWTITITQNGAVIRTDTGVSGARDGGAYTYNALDAILYGGAAEYNAWNVDGTVKMYITELRDISNAEEPDGLPGDEITECAAMLGTMDTGSNPMQKTTEIAAPEGFGSVYKYEDQGEAFHGGNYSNVCLTEYSVVTFAVKSAKMKLYGDWNESNDWLVFTMTQTSEAVWTITITQNGAVIRTDTGVSGARDGGAYTYNALDAILYGGAAEYNAWNVDGTVKMYITELRDISNVEQPEVELVGDEITECAAMLGTMDTGSKPMQKTTEIAAPEGFGSVYKYEDQGEVFHGANYSNVCLTEYSVVRFAVKSAKMKIYDTWYDCEDWLIFTLTQTSEAVWTITVTQNGVLVRTDTGISGSRNDGAYAYNALDAILYGGNPEYVAGAVNGTVTMYITELRDISNVNPTIEVTDKSFLVKSNGDKWSYDTGDATISLTDFNLPSVTSILIDGEPFNNFSFSGSNLVLKNAPGGDHVYTFIYGEVGYRVNGCVYANGISTVEELETWRRNESYWYTVLLNDINYNGQTLITEGNEDNIIGVLDGRGYTISNFTHTTGFVNTLYGTNSVIKNVSFKGVTHDVTKAANKSYGLFGCDVQGTIENIYLEVATVGGTGEHYGVLVNAVNGIAKNIIVNITSSYADVGHYIMAANYAITLENVYGVYSNTLLRWCNNHGVEEYPINYTYKTAKQLIENNARALILGGYWKNTYDSLVMDSIDQKNAQNNVEDNYIVKDGKTEYVIVIEDALAEEYSIAAQELYYLFYEATGIKFTFASSLDVDYTDEAKFIYLGNSDLSVGLGVDLDALGTQGFTIKTYGQSIFIIANPQGVLYGVYELLNETLNFETYTKEITTLDKNVSVIALPQLDLTQVPDVEYRFAFSGVQYADEVSRRRMRTLNTGDVMVDGGWAHNMLSLIVPFDTYRKTNSSWFSNQTRLWDDYEGTQLCYTAGGRDTTSYSQMLEVAYNNVISLLAEDTDPNHVFMSLTQMDVDGKWCACSGCKSVINTYGSNSATQILFINDLTSRVQAWLNSKQSGREVQFLMFAYYDSIDAPTKGNLKLNNNVSVWIAPINDNYMLGVNASGNELGATLQGWKNVASSVAIWGYNVYFTDYLVPYNTYDQIDQMIDACVASNANYMWIQGNWNTTQNTGFDGLKAYLISKLMWDSTLDVNELTNAYFNAVYGAAASDMLTVYNAMKTELNRITNNGATAGVPSYTSWGLDYLKTQLDRLVAAIGKLDKSDANYQKYYDAIVCESISIRYIYESKRGKTYSTSVWGSFSSEAQRLGFIMKSEQDKL